ncbi:MAG: helix-turn-helix transcriptional regulator [Desulfobacterales bacterium]|nr:helix-turn-helix transcriptional regulator [Desulfobacterales bacterium]
MPPKKKKMNKKLLIIIGNNIRENRKEKGLTQEELASKANLHRTYIGMIERAEKNLTVTNLQKIAEALEVSTGSLLD